jgi:hypothetical protein
MVIKIKAMPQMKHYVHRRYDINASPMESWLAAGGRVYLYSAFHLEGSQNDLQTVYRELFTMEIHPLLGEKAEVTPC